MTQPAAFVGSAFASFSWPTFFTFWIPGYGRRVFLERARALPQKLRAPISAGREAVGHCLTLPLSGERPRAPHDRFDAFAGCQSSASSGSLMAARGPPPSALLAAAGCCLPQAQLTQTVIRAVETFGFGSQMKHPSPMV